MVFTIAIPAFNGSKTIRTAIESALYQDYDKGYEVLIIDNNSSDNTQEIIKSFNDPKIRCVKNDITIDVFANHYKCLEEGMGEYVLILHADDRLNPNALSILHKEVEKLGFPKKFIIWGHSMFRDYYVNFQRAGQPINTIICGQPALNAFIDMALTPSGTCYSRVAMMEIKPYPIRSALEAFDWYIMIMAYFYNFEFEMIDRLLFIREDASTAVRSYKLQDYVPPYASAYSEMIKNLNPNQKWDLHLAMYHNARIDHYPFFKKGLSLKSRIVFLWRAFKKIGLLRIPFNLKYIFMQV